MARKKAKFNQKNKNIEFKNHFPKIFVSFYGEDGAKYAEDVQIKLSSYMADIYVSGLQAPEESSWPTVIRNHLAGSDLFIYIATPDSTKNDRVRFEVELALRQKGTRIVPIAFKNEVGSLITPNSIISAVDTLWLTEPISALIAGPSESIIRHIVLTQELKRREHQTNEPRITPLETATSSRPLNEGKLILIGRGEVGKTSLVNRLVSNRFDGNEKKTEGISINKWSLAINGANYNINVWDFGGQEIMHATHQFFLTERSAYLIVLNGREGGEDADVEYWLKHVQSFGGESPVIIVLNKFSQHPFELNFRGLQAKYPQIRSFIRTDCKDATGIDLLRLEIEKTIISMPEVKADFPEDWFKIKTRLEGMTKEFLSFTEFHKMCFEEHITEEKDINLLCWILHCLGISLNYNDDCRLRETSVLKPEWVTQGIYKIINAQGIFKKHGELHIDELKQILPPDRYPENRHFFIIELMRKFSLCFAFGEDAKKYLIPELLGKEEPADISNYDRKECLNFEYHYGIFPEGLIPRFIVRSHTLSQGQKRWRTGVILNYENCNALVVGSSTDRRITVKVKGNNANARRRLLGLIRHEIDKINLEFKDRLDVQEKVPLPTNPEVSIDYRKLAILERDGIESFPEVLDSEETVWINVKDLLNGVDLNMQRNNSINRNSTAKSIFFSYSHKDEQLRDELELHLKLLKREGLITTWHDRKITPGSEWDEEIDRNLQHADIILLLVSINFLASDYIWTKEMDFAIKQHEANRAIVVPIFIKHCNWKNTPLAKIQGLPKDGTPVTEWADRDLVWTHIENSIRNLLTKPQQ